MQHVEKARKIKLARLMRLSEAIMKTKPTLLQSLVLLGVLVMMPVVVQAQTENPSNFLYTINSTYNTIYTTYATYNFDTYTITFGNDNNQVFNVTIPSSINGIPVTSIADYANTSIGTSLTIPDSVRTIGVSAFNRGLTNIIIGSGVTNIGSGAFARCPGLQAAYFLGNAPSLGTNVFDGDTNVIVYHLPHSTGWSNTFAGHPTAQWNPPLPALGISTYSNQPLVFFPLPASIGTNYVLQMTTNLASGNWVTVTNSIPFISLQITNAPSPAFFRLQ